MKCSYCSSENPQEKLFCNQCGWPLERMPPRPAESREIRCEYCGVMNPDGASVCMCCNQLLVPGMEKEVIEKLEKPVLVPPGVCPKCGHDKNPLAARFCMKCGAEMIPAQPVTPVMPMVQPVARLVLPSRREIVISELERTIGRTDFPQDLPGEELKFISREHLKILFENGRYFVMDGGSANGTTLNDIEIKGQGKKELNHNDEIVLAKTLRLKFQMR